MIGLIIGIIVIELILIKSMKIAKNRILNPSIKYVNKSIYHYMILSGDEKEPLMPWFYFNAVNCKHFKPIRHNDYKKTVNMWYDCDCKLDNGSCTMVWHNKKCNKFECVDFDK